MSEAWLNIAKNLAQQAGHRVMELRDSDLQHERKADQSLVTIADHSSDRLVCAGLREHFPSHRILSEESGLSGPETSEYLWLIDPLDGTKAYAKGIPGFSIMLGLLKNQQPYLGVVMDPIEGHLYAACRGFGAWHEQAGIRTQLHVSARQDFAEMPLIRSTGFPETALGQLRQKLNLPLTDPINSVGIKVGLLVRQIGDVYINHHSVHYWDTCAPQVILEAAGGRFTRIDGQALTYALDGVYSHQSLTLASNNTRHEDLVKACKNLNFA